MSRVMILSVDDINELSRVHEAVTGDGFSFDFLIFSPHLNFPPKNTWNLTPPPENKNVIGSKWAHKVKRNADGSVERFKAKLKAQKNSQSKGIDYEDVFAPAARYNSFKLNISNL